MKKFFIIIIFVIISTFFTTVYASDKIEVKVPVDLSPMWLHCAADQGLDENNKVVETGTFTCHIDTWFASILEVIWQIIKYFTFLTWLAWVLFIIFNWIKLSMAWINAEYEKEAKDNIKKTLFWLILLLLSWLILNFIAPWVYT